MSGAEYAWSRIATEGPALASRPAARRRRTMARVRAGVGRSPLISGAIVCLLLGILSVLTMPSPPDYDPFAWVVWGRELAHQIVGRHDLFVVEGGPSWKPLPVAFTTVFGFFGPAP